MSTGNEKKLNFANNIKKISRVSKVPLSWKNLYLRSPWLRLAKVEHLIGSSQFSLFLIPDVYQGQR